MPKYLRRPPTNAATRLTGVLDGLKGLPVNYDESAAPPHVTAGWHQDRWTVELGHEEPGEPGALAEAAYAMVDGYEFTNPHLLRAVYRRGAELVGRDMLLEGRFLRLRFLMGVRITEQHDERRTGEHGPERAVGWSYQTLAGHLEQGHLTYEVVKELDTGRVTFSIIAYSRQAPIPNLVLHLGFRVFGRPNQVRFYRHAGRRMRELVTASPADRPSPPTASGEQLVHAPTGAPPGRAEWSTLVFRHPGRTSPGPGGVGAGRAGTSVRMTSTWSALLRGAAAGAAGTTALNATTQLDMAVRGRPASEAPQQVVAALADRAGVDIPGGRRARQRRIAGLGPLSGTVTGVAVGAAAGLLRAAGVRLPTVVGGPLLGAAAMLAADGPVALLGVADPRRWTTTDWLADAVPHLVYGVTTHRVLESSVPRGEARAARPPAGVLLRAAALGAATGVRSSSGLLAVAASSSPDDHGPVVSRLGRGRATAATALMAASEVALDKSPIVPPRTSLSGLGPRALLGATTASAVARREGHDGTLAGAVGLGAAVATAVLGTQARSLLARRLGSDLPGAFAEDVIAGGLAWFGSRRR